MEQLLKIVKFVEGNWPLLLPVVLGFLAVYCLLPRVRRNLLVPGALVGAGALVAAGWFLIHRQVVVIEAILFYTFAGIAVLGAGLMLAQHNPVRAALLFGLVVLSSCGLFLLLAAPFLMAATLIIYGGAIIITFLFVIMLAQQIGMTSADRRSREPFLASLAGFVLLACLIVVLHENYDAHAIEEQYRPVLDKLQRAAQAKTFNDMKAALANTDPLKDENSLVANELVDAMKALLPIDYNDKVEMIEDYLAPSGQQVNVHKWCVEMAGILEKHYEQAKLGVGSLRANPPGASPDHVLRADNVAQLGKSLFTEYLVAVEIAGVLLLVATIGAIVIAGRRGDKATGEVLR